MKKTYYIIATVVVALVVGVGAWWMFRDKGDVCAAALPQDITMLGRVNPSDLVVQNNINIDEIKNLLEVDEEKTGMNFKASSYVFDFRGYFGLVVPLEESDEFDRFLQSRGCTLERQRGFTWTVLEKSFLLCHDDDKAMAIGPATAEEMDALRGEIARLMDQRESESGKQSDLFQTLSLRTEPAAVVCNLSIIPDAYQKYIEYTLPEHVKLDEISVSAGIKAAGDRLKMKITLHSDNQHAKDYLQAINQALIPLNGDLLESTPDNPFLIFAAGINGSELLQVFRQNPETRTWLLAANMGMDLDMVIRSLQGDVMVTYPKIPMLDSRYLMMAQLNSTEFVSHIPSWNEECVGLHVYPARDDRYVLSYGDMLAYFGVRDTTLFVSNSDYMSLLPATEGQGVVDQRLSFVKNKVYISLSLKDTAPIAQVVKSFFPNSNLDFLESMHSITLCTANCKDWNLQLVADDKLDILKKLFE